MLVKNIGIQENSSSYKLCEIVQQKVKVSREVSNYGASVSSWLPSVGSKFAMACDLVASEI